MTDICPKSIELKTAAELLTLHTAEGITEYLRQAAPSHPLLNQVFRMQRIAQISDERTVALLAYYALVALEKSQAADKSASNFVSDVPPGNGPSCGYCGAIMVSTAWQCKSCGTATETSAQASPAESIAETAHPEPGEWVPHNLETQWQCCDCKLVHVVRFRLSETGQLEVSMTRDEDETSKVRGGTAKEWLK